MVTELFFSSQEMASLLKVSNRDLAERRNRGELNYLKQDTFFLYSLRDISTLKHHPLTAKLINWYKLKHDVVLDNNPEKLESELAIYLMIKNILLPVERKFGVVTITYGFISKVLNRYIQANNAAGTCPSIDQHSSFELNMKSNLICNRAGFACDFTVVGYESNMAEIVEYIVDTLDYDKLYFYNADRPIHVSVNKTPLGHLQIMGQSDNGRRYPKQKAYGQDASKLIKDIKNGCR